jgi:hypothetical protein
VARLIHAQNVLPVRRQYSSFCRRAGETAVGLRLDLVSPSLLKQELAHFSNDQRFVYYEHVLAGVMQFDDS